ncbi:MAG TPA: type II toxin-antitoxin system HicB family antitoxin [Frankiaceae bacterium]|nr:type II toxin-antitoxin system HicB family antitoxin [Frankiaceae bacterium]
MEIKVTLTVHTEDDGSFWAEVEEFPGCFASARDRAQLLEAVQEAVALYIQDGDVTEDELRALALPDPPLAPVVPLVGRGDAAALPDEGEVRLVVEA